MKNLQNANSKRAILWYNNPIYSMNSLENSPFLNRLKGALHKEQQTEPSPEQLQTLHRIREILLTEDHPGMTASRSY